MTTAVIGATGRVSSDVAEAFDGIRLVFIAMGSIGISLDFKRRCDEG